MLSTQKRWQQATCQGCVAACLLGTTSRLLAQTHKQFDRYDSQHHPLHTPPTWHASVCAPDPQATAPQCPVGRVVLRITQLHTARATKAKVEVEVKVKERQVHAHHSLSVVFGGGEVRSGVRCVYGTQLQKVASGGRAQKRAGGRAHFREQEMTGTVSSTHAHRHTHLVLCLTLALVVVNLGQTLAGGTDGDRVCVARRPKVETSSHGGECCNGGGVG